MMRRGMFLLIWIAWLAGCVGRTTRGPQAGVARPPTSNPTSVSASLPVSADFGFHSLSNAGRYRVSWTPMPNPPVINEPCTLRVLVEYSNGQPDGEIGLRVDAAMPAHGHGLVERPVVQPVGRGVFGVEGLRFHMAGHWELYFDISTAGYTERAQFDIDLD